MKKWIALLLSLVMVLSLFAACGKQDVEDQTGSDQNQTEENDTTDTQPDDSQDNDAENQPEEKPEDSSEEQPEEKPEEKPDATGPSLSLDKNDFTLFAAGESYQMTATLQNVEDEGEMVWTSSDPAIATVKDGLVTAVAPGNATITVTNGDLKATCIVRCNWEAQSTGGNTTESSTTVDLTAFFDTISSNYELASMTDLDSELLENYYPGITGYTLNQCVAKASMISAVVSEIVLVECANADDAAAVAAILQARIDAQVDGGAWYPSSIQQWESAQLVTSGNYVAMIACADSSADIADDFLAEFN